MNNKCLERSCRFIEADGSCVKLTSAGGSDKVFCGWYENVKTSQKCDTCSMAIKRGDKKLKYCIYFNKAIPPKKDACPNYAEAT